MPRSVHPRDRRQRRMCPISPRQAVSRSPSPRALRSSIPRQPLAQGDNAMAQDIVNSTLQQQLDDFKAQLAQQMPDTVARLGEDAEALVRTGIASQSLKEGEQAPDFTLPDAFGHSVTLSEFLKRGPVVLTFYRGEWCPYCN